MRRKFVIAGEYYDHNKANMAKLLLEQNGIEAYLENQNLVGINPIYSFAVGGIRLTVSEEDKEYAIKVLEQNIEHNIRELAEDESIDELGLEEGLDFEKFEEEERKNPESIILCPKCKSDFVDLDKPLWGNFTFYSILLTAIIVIISRQIFVSTFIVAILIISILYGKNKYKCRDCKYEWKD